MKTSIACKGTLHTTAAAALVLALLPPIVARELGKPDVNPGVLFDNWDAQSHVLPSSMAGERISRNGVIAIAVDPRVSWSSDIVGTSDEIQYVFLSIYASVGTVIDVAGSRIKVDAGYWMEKGLCLAAPANPRSGSFGCIFVERLGKDGPQWESTNHEMPVQVYFGRKLVCVAALTVKINRAEGSWSLFMRQDCIADGLPLIKTGDVSGISVLRIRGGDDGALLCSADASPHHPLFRDSNHNSIPDEFEAEQLSSPDRSEGELRKRWRSHLEAGCPELPMRLLAPDAGSGSPTCH